MNWVAGPAVMFTLAWALLPDQPAYRTGVILVMLARCIAMVLIWTDLAGGDREMAAVLVALNAVFQVLTRGLLPECAARLAGPGHRVDEVSIGTIASTVAIFLSIPLMAGYLTRILGERRRGREWYETRLLPRIGPIALYGLLFTVVIMFALQGKKITSEPLDVARIALPLLCYFTLLWCGGFAVGRRLRLSYRRTAALAFSAASNDFELGHRGRDRRFRCQQRSSTGRCRRTTHRSARAAGTRLRGPVGAAPFLPARRGDRVMDCYDCATTGNYRHAVAVSVDCGAGVCVEHAVNTRHWLTREMATFRTQPVDPPARLISCGTCHAAHAARGDVATAANYGVAQPATTPG